MLTQSRLKELMHYNPDTGVFTWLKSRGGGVKAGDIAGVLHHSGYVLIRTGGKVYLAHRLAWLYKAGCWPADMVDHINRNKADNRWCNLREATRSQNAQNAGLQENNTSGVRGVHWNKREGKWCVRCMLGGKRYSFGLYDDLKTAAAVAADARKKLYGEFASCERDIIAYRIIPGRATNQNGEQ